MSKKETISFTITNSLNASIPVNLLGNLANTADNANATTLYFWDVTSLVITNETLVEIQYATTGSPTFSTAQAILGGNTRQSVVDALNTLGLGGFGLLFSGGIWFIFNYNLTFQFGYLNVFNPLIIPTTFAGNISGIGNTFTFLINAVPQVTFTNPPPAISGTYNAAVGDNLSISGNSGAGGLFLLYVYQDPDNLLLTTINVPAPATPFVFNWVALANKNYRVQSFP